MQGRAEGEGVGWSERVGCEVWELEFWSCRMRGVPVPACLWSEGITSSQEGLKCTVLPMRFFFIL